MTEKQPYTPREAPTHMVDQALATLRHRYPQALLEPDFLQGLMVGLDSANKILHTLGDRAAVEAGAAAPVVNHFLSMGSRSLGDTHALYEGIYQDLFVEPDGGAGS